MCTVSGRSRGFVSSSVEMKTSKLGNSSCSKGFKYLGLMRRSSVLIFPSSLFNLDCGLYTPFTLLIKIVIPSVRVIWILRER